MSSRAAAAATERIPLTVIGGFLGAGKTTLLNHLLRHADGRRLALLVNDFGAVNIDAALVESRDGDVVQLANGCVCCSIGNDLSDALARVLAAPRPPEAIVVEASGVSDPWRIAQVGLADPALALGGVVVLVDAEAVRAQLADPLLADTVQRQLDAADLLVLNKCDRLDEAGRAALRAWLEQQRPDTPFFEAVQGRVPPLLLGLVEPAATERPRLLCSCGQAHDEPGHAHHDAAAPAHDQQFESCALDAPGVYSVLRLKALLRAMPPGVLRLKGLLATDQHDCAVLQFAGRHGSLRADPRPAAARPATRALVAIGLRGRLPAAALRQALDGARLQLDHAEAA